MTSSFVPLAVLGRRALNVVVAAALGLTLMLVGTTQANALIPVSTVTQETFALAADELAAVNAKAASVGEALLPADTVSLISGSDGSVVAVSANGVKTPMGFWGSAWRWTKCVASVVAVFLPAAKAYKAIRALGGAYETARLLWVAGNASDFYRIAGGAAADILGISGVQKYCFG